MRTEGKTKNGSIKILNVERLPVWLVWFLIESYATSALWIFFLCSRVKIQCRFHSKEVFLFFINVLLLVTDRWEFDHPEGTPLWLTWQDVQIKSLNDPQQIRKLMGICLQTTCTLDNCLSNIGAWHKPFCLQGVGCWAWLLVCCVRAD